MRLPAAFHAASFIVALFVQSMSTPLAATWLFFHVAGCCCLHDPRQTKTFYWWLCLAWLLTLAASTFFLAPVVNGAATFWILAAMPMMAICMRKEYLPAYTDAFMAVLVLYACGLIIQMMLGVHYTVYEYGIPCRSFRAAAWPMIDPNNAACVINCGLIPAFYMALRKPKWFVPAAIFSVALFGTGSKAGAIAGAISCAILTYEQFGSLPLLLLCLPALALTPHILHPMCDAASAPSAAQLIMKASTDRLDIWKTSLPLLGVHPWTGLGLGSFHYYYEQIRQATDQDVYFAHNDVLQFAIEMGIPSAFIFLVLVAHVFDKTVRKNIAAACVLLAIFLEAMAEFQFYVPAVSLLAGLALAYHRLYSDGLTKESLCRNQITCKRA